MNKIIFFGGKGGVGKTTCSCGYAVNSSNKGEKTLLVSTDPAHSISDLFDKNIGNEVIQLKENLFALEIDPEYESIKYMNNIRKNLRSIVSPIIVEEINRQLDAAIISPGTQESALFDKIIDIIISEADIYDKIIFDTAPTGHTIRLLSLPELLGGWIDSLIKKRRKALKLRQMSRQSIRKDKEYINNDPIITALSNRKEKLEKARKIIIDYNKLSFVFVTNAERLPIYETKKAVNILENYSLTINKIIINRILPDKVEDEFWRNKKELENKYIEQINEVFENKDIIKLPLLSEDIGENNINLLAKHFENVL